jgi:hypothetical protein
VNQFVPRCPSSQSRVSRRYLELANVLQMLPHYSIHSVTEAAGASDCRECGSGSAPAAPFIAALAIS